MNTENSLSLDVKASILDLIIKNNKEEIESLLTQATDIAKNELLNYQAQTLTMFSFTPLYLSVKLRRKEILLMLLKYGADINTIVNDFEECCGTPLDLATLRGDKEITEIIKKYAFREEIETCPQFENLRQKPVSHKRRKFNTDYYNKKNSKRGDELAMLAAA